MSGDRQGSSGRPPHPAKVAQPKTSFGGPAQRPPHPAKVAQPKAPPQPSARERPSPHPATAQRKGAPPHPATTPQQRPKSASGDALQPMLFSNLGKQFKSLVSGLVDGFSFDPLLRPGYTSCVCLVFTNKDDQHIPQAANYFGPQILDGMKNRWLEGRQRPPLRYCSVNKTTVEDFGSEFWNVLIQHDKGLNDLGPRPLIILVGHCAPGSDQLRSMEQEPHEVEWVANWVFELVQRVFAVHEHARPTVFLSMCSSGEAGDDMPSFQDLFDTRLAKSLRVRTFPDEFFSIGTIGTSCPLPFFGKVVTTGGFRFTRRDPDLGTRQVRSAEQEKQDYEALD